jgi:LPS sulfotransferase NodH
MFGRQVVKALPAALAPGKTTGKFPLPYQKTKYEVKISRIFKRELGPFQRPASYEPPSSVFICFTNRCGSNYLAAALESTGRLPRAGEVFGDGIFQNAKLKLGAKSFDEACIQIAKRRMANGIFSAKIAWFQLYLMTKAGIIPHVYGNPKFILISRRDLLDQAISLTIARQSKAWTSDLPKTTQPVYNRAGIIAAIRALAHCNAQFQMYFSTFGISPFEVVYEDFITDAPATVRRILDWAELGPGEMDPSKIKIRQQRDSLNAEWRSRFLGEAGSFGDKD